jgi:hypothetical protein
LNSRGGWFGIGISGKELWDESGDPREIRRRGFVRWGRPCDRARHENE